MKNFVLTVDVTMSGDIYIEAENEKEAEEKLRLKEFVPSDLRWFHHLDTNLVDIEEEQ